MVHTKGNLSTVAAIEFSTYLINNGFNFEVSCSTSGVSIWASEKAIQELDIIIETQRVDAMLAGQKAAEY